MTFLKRGWVLLVVVVALIVGGVAVVRLNGVFPGPGLPKPDPRDAT
ncbi:MmpS family transport accessory protein, partial [Mycobacterium avium]